MSNTLVKASQVRRAEGMVWRYQIANLRLDQYAVAVLHTTETALEILAAEGIGIVSGRGVLKLAEQTPGSWFRIP